MQINSGQKFGGVSSMLFNIYKNIDHNQVQFDFVAPQTSSFKICQDQIEQMGGRIIELKTSGNFLKRKAQFFHRLVKLIRKNRYQVVHINSGSIFLNIQVAWIAHFCGVKKIISHSHSSRNDHLVLQYLTKVCKPLLEFGPTDYFACSKKAAEFMFTSKRIKQGKFKIIKNAIDPNDFHFDKQVRASYRHNMHLENQMVILHVGRFTEAKNDFQLIDIFKTLHHDHPHSVLLLAGAGKLEKAVRKKVKDENLNDCVRFLGLRQDVPQLMSAADAFLLPSLYEGLPVVGVEAQATGLPCIFSDTITREVDIVPGLTTFVGLKCSNETWRSHIDRLLTESRKISRNDTIKSIRAAGFVLSDVAQKLQKIYLEAL